eukprot:2263913-Rhodomonas_salina.6
MQGTSLPISSTRSYRLAAPAPSWYWRAAPGTALGTGDTASHSSVPPMKGNKFNPESGIASPGLGQSRPVSG